MKQLSLCYKESCSTHQHTEKFMLLGNTVDILWSEGQSIILVLFNLCLVAHLQWKLRVPSVHLPYYIQSSYPLYSTAFLNIFRYFE